LRIAESTFSLVATTTSLPASASPAASKSPVEIPTSTPGSAANASYFSRASARSGQTYSPGPSAVNSPSSATNVLPEAVGIAATTFSPSQTPASTAAACGGYSSRIPRSAKWSTYGSASGRSLTRIRSSVRSDRI
jgi:hypothetical protein